MGRSGGKSVYICRLSIPEQLFETVTTELKMAAVLLKTSIVQFQKNIHTPATEGIGISWGWKWGFGPKRPNLSKKCMQLIAISRGMGFLKKFLPWQRYGYFLELHVVNLLTCKYFFHHCVANQTNVNSVSLHVIESSENFCSKIPVALTNFYSRKHIFFSFILFICLFT